MKAKDIVANMPGYFLTRDSFRPKVVFIAQSLRVGNSVGWRTSTTDFHTKYVAQHTRLAKDRSELGVDTGNPWVDKMMPNQLAQAMTKEEALAYVVARREREDRKSNDADLYNKHAHKLVTALEAAGFAGFHDRYKGVTLDRAAVVRWLREHGEV